MREGNVTIQDEASTLPEPFVGTFTRDLTLAAGTQAVTGIGFRPSAVFIHGGVSSSEHVSWGFGTAAGARNMRDRFALAVNTYTVDPAVDNIINTLTGAADESDGELDSMDVDGFTINWIKFGSPSGTGRYNFIAFK